MKIVRSIATHDGAARWGYLAFVLTMLHLVHRARNKDVVKEVRATPLLSRTWMYMYLGPLLTVGCVLLRCIQNMLSFAAALLPTELSHKFIALNAGVVYWLKKSKTPILSGWVGSIAGFVQCIVMVRLFDIYKSNVNAKHSIRSAMEEQSDIPAEKLQQIGDLSLRNWLSVMLPLPQTMALSLSYPGVATTEAVTFAYVGKNSTTRLRMDVYKHKDAKPNAPILLYVHGGGWIMGDRKNPPRPLIYQAACLGWVVCVIDYRLSPKIAFPEHLIDCKRAIAYLREHARGDFDADPEYIVVGGESAGGHLASLVALTSGDKSLQPGFEDVDTSVRGCIDTYGVHDFKDRHGIYFYKDRGYSFVRFIELLVMQKKMKEAGDDYDQASPMSWVQELKTSERNDTIPPFLVSHGTHDTLVPFKDSLLFFEKLQRYRQRKRKSNQQPTIGGVEDVFLEIPDAHHAFNYLVSPRALAHGEAVCAFLTNLHAKTKHIPLGVALNATDQLPLDTTDASKDPLTTFSLSAEISDAAPTSTTTGPAMSRL